MTTKASSQILPLPYWEADQRLLHAEERKKKTAFCFCAKEFWANKARLPAEFLLGCILSAHTIGFLFLAPITTTTSGRRRVWGMERVIHVAHCSATWILWTNAQVGKKGWGCMQSVTISQLMVQLTNAAILQKRRRFRTLTLYEVMMSSQGIQGGAEMPLIKCMVWIEQHEESNWLQLSVQFGSHGSSDKSKQITIPGFLMPPGKSCNDYSALAP